MINVSVTLRENPAKREEPKKAYGTAQYTEKMTLEEFASHISSHNSVYDEGDVVAILSKAVKCLREMLLAGKKIELGSLGEFAVSLRSRGAESIKDYVPENYIERVNVVWTPGARFQDLKKEATFQIVPSRESAARLTRALRQGETSVDLTPDERPQKPSTPSDGGGSGTTTPPSGGGSSTGGDSSTGSGDDSENVGI